MKKLFVGIDVSKDVFDFCALNENGVIETSKEVFENSKKGISSFCKSLKRWDDYDVWICLEHTGHYGYLLASEFSERNIKYTRPAFRPHSSGFEQNEPGLLRSSRLRTRPDGGGAFRSRFR